MSSDRNSDLVFADRSPIQPEKNSGDAKAFLRDSIGRTE